MRHRSLYWPMRHAFAGNCNTRSTSPEALVKENYMQTRWHGHRGASFGVRRPLRYLAHNLDLDEHQVRRMATVLNQLKTEREQAALDEKRTIAGLAALMETGTPTLEDCRTELAGRTRATEQLNEETAKSIVAICELLDDDQRAEFVNLMLTGDFTL
jgi:hypothetical protein